MTTTANVTSARRGSCKIVRVYFDGRRRKIVKRNLSIAKARAWIASPKAIQKIGARPVYIDGYSIEKIAKRLNGSASDHGYVVN